MSIIVIVCFAHFLQIVWYEMFWVGVRGYYSFVLCTVGVPSNNLFCVATFAGALYDSFDCVFVSSRVLFAFTLLLRC